MSGELSSSSEEARIFLPTSMALSTEAARMTPAIHTREAQIQKTGTVDARCGLEGLGRLQARTRRAGRGSSHVANAEAAASGCPGRLRRCGARDGASKVRPAVARQMMPCNALLLHARPGAHPGQRPSAKSSACHPGPPPLYTPPRHQRQKWPQRQRRRGSACWPSSCHPSWPSCQKKWCWVSSGQPCCRLQQGGERQGRRKVGGW